MSATGRSDVRQRDDFYETPDYCVDELLRYVSIPRTAHICEPCAGSGAIVKRLLHHGFQSIEAMELCPTRGAPLFSLPLASVQIGDALTLTPCYDVDVTISNPPYRPAQAIIERWLTLTPGVVAMLLRLDFIAAKCRRSLMGGKLPDLFVFERRPSYVRNVRYVVVKAKKIIAGPFGDLAKATKAAERRGGRVRKRTVSNDSCEYAWCVWGLPGPGGRWQRILNGDLPS